MDSRTSVIASGVGLRYDPYDKGTALNPHPLFRRLRDEKPLYFNEEHGFYALSRFDDIQQALKNRDAFLSGRGVTLESLKSNEVIPPGTVVMEDPPHHAIHRSLLSRLFTPKSISELEQRIREMCGNLLDSLDDLGHFDLVKDLGQEMPTRVVGMLVGIPEEDQESIRDFFVAARHRDASSDHSDILSGTLFADYIDWRAEHPSDDVMTQLLFAEFEDETGTRRRLTREELLAYINIVVAAGNETTKLLIGWMGKILAEHPGEIRVLVDNPLLIPSAIEEILRLEPPTLQLCRYVALDVEYYGQMVPRGSIMALLLGSANRDDRHLAQPDQFNVRRDFSQHVTFGFGPHYCLGQALARLEGRVALEELLKRVQGWEVDWDNAKFASSSDLRGWESLPLFVS